MYSAHNEGKSVIAERFIRTLKSRIYRYMTSIPKNVYIEKLDDTYHSTIKMKPVDVKSDPKFKIGDIARTLKYKNIFAKGYFPNWSEEDFVIKKVKNTVPQTYVISDFKGRKIAGTFYEK